MGANITPEALKIQLLAEGARIDSEGRITHKGGAEAHRVELWEAMHSGNNGKTKRARKTVAAPNASEAATPKRELGPVVKLLADVQPRPVDWLWPGRIPLGRVTLLVGAPGEGKSFLTCDWASRVSTGSPWPDGSPCVRGSVLLLSAEDDLADTIRPRLDAHHADLNRIRAMTGVMVGTERGDVVERIVTLDDLGSIELALRELEDCRLLVIDPIGSYLSGRVDAHRDNEVRSKLAPIAALGERYGCAVLVVAHRRKAVGGSADDMTMGSRAFTGLARSVLHVCRYEESKTRRVLVSGKNNLAERPAGLVYSIGGEPALVRWERGSVDMTADEALAAEQHAAKETPSHEAVAAVVERLGGACSPRELAKAVHPLRKTADAEAKLHEMASNGWGRWETHHANGRPATRFVLARPGESRPFGESALNPDEDGGFADDGRDVVEL